MRRSVAYDMRCDYRLCRLLFWIVCSTRAPHTRSREAPRLRTRYTPRRMCCDARPRPSLPFLPTATISSAIPPAARSPRPRSTVTHDAHHQPHAQALRRAYPAPHTPQGSLPQHDTYLVSAAPEAGIPIVYVATHRGRLQLDVHSLSPDYHSRKNASPAYVPDEDDAPTTAMRSPDAAVVYHHPSLDRDHISPIAIRHRCSSLHGDFGTHHRLHAGRPSSLALRTPRHIPPSNLRAHASTPRTPRIAGAVLVAFSPPAPVPPSTIPHPPTTA
jgi:hypothetical protein